MRQYITAANAYLSSDAGGLFCCHLPVAPLADSSVYVVHALVHALTCIYQPYGRLLLPSWCA